MTDLQLSVLLRQYARQIDAEISVIKRMVDEGSAPQFWEQRTPPLGKPEMECILVDGLYHLARAIEEDADSLKGSIVKVLAHLRDESQ